MTAYTQIGNRAQAIRAYKRCVENLQSELGVSPTKTTFQLWQQISGKSQAALLSFGQADEVKA